MASLIAPNATTNFPSIVVPNPEISPPKTVVIIVNTSPNIPPQSIPFRKFPIPLPSPAQSVFFATSENTLSKFLTKLLKICPFSSQLTSVMNVLIPCEIFAAISDHLTVSLIFPNTAKIQLIPVANVSAIVAKSMLLNNPLTVFPIATPICWNPVSPVLSLDAS